MPRRIQAVFVLLVATLVPSAAADGAAVTVQGDAVHSGNAGPAGLRPPLMRRWKRSFDGLAGYPIIAGGRVFVAIARPFPRGSYVLALDARRGRVLWTRDLGAKSDSAALAYGSDRLIVVRESYFDNVSGVLALDPTGGRVLWETGTDIFTATAPVADRGVVYVNGLNGIGVTALRESDGAVLWRAETDSGEGGSPAVSGDAVFAAMSPCPDVHRFRRSDGAEVWHPENGCHGGGGSIPVVHRDRLYVTESARFPPGDVYNPATGVILGSMRADWTPAFAGGMGVFPDAREPGEQVLFGHTLVARRVADGRVRWRYDGDGYLDGPPLIAGRTVYVGSGSGRVYGVSLRSGRGVWSADAGAPIPAQWMGRMWVGLGAAEGLLVVPALGRLVAFS
jgi:eukaryotic-like serine/threonine-protein kinase